CLAAGMDDFLTKPVIPDLLYKTLSTWIAAGPCRGAADDANGPPGGAASADAEANATPADADADLSVLSAAVGGDPDKTRKFALMFVDTMSKTLTELDDALASGDLAAVSALGHRAKSSAATVGAAELARLCQSLQDMKGQGDIEDARETVRSMASLNARITDQIARTFA
ncbi:MAG: Hpt domain-containing protein, partial [Caldimonas sp.]